MADIDDPDPRPSRSVGRDERRGAGRLRRWSRTRVKGSPHFFVASDDFFCPALDLGHDADGHLTARFDADVLADFFSRIDAS